MCVIRGDSPTEELPSKHKVVWSWVTCLYDTWYYLVVLTT